jgi:hypothetical protein
MRRIKRDKAKQEASMSRKFKGTFALAGVLALSLTVFAVGVSGKSKIRRVGTSVQVEESSKTGKRNITVGGVIQSSVPKCERGRSVLLYQDGPGGTYVGNALGHAVTLGGNSRGGEFTIAGISPKKILNSRRFRVEAVGRKVVVKGKSVICKRGVSVQFPADFG